MNKKIASEIAIGIILLIALVFGGPFYFSGTNQKQNDNKNPNVNTNAGCAWDSKKCPDGTLVGRSGTNCDFVCPDKTLNEVAIESEKLCPQINQQSNEGKQKYKIIKFTDSGSKFSFEVPNNWLTETRRPTNKNLTPNEMRKFLEVDCAIAQKSYSSDYFNQPSIGLMSDEDIIDAYNGTGDDWLPFPNASVAAGDHIWYHDTSWEQIDFYILKNFSSLKTYFNDVKKTKDNKETTWSRENIDDLDAEVAVFSTDTDENGYEAITKGGSGAKIYYIKLNSKDVFIINKQAKGDNQFELDFKNLIKTLKIEK